MVTLYKLWCQRLILTHKNFTGLETTDRESQWEKRVMEQQSCEGGEGKAGERVGRWWHASNRIHNLFLNGTTPPAMLTRQWTYWVGKYSVLNVDVHCMNTYRGFKSYNSKFKAVWPYVQYNTELCTCSSGSLQDIPTSTFRGMNPAFNEF